MGEILRNQLLNHASSDRKWEVIAKIIANGELAPQVRPSRLDALRLHFDDAPPPFSTSPSRFHQRIRSLFWDVVVV